MNTLFKFPPTKHGYEIEQTADSFPTFAFGSNSKGALYTVDTQSLSLFPTNSFIHLLPFLILVALSRYTSRFNTRTGFDPDTNKH